MLLSVRESEGKIDYAEEIDTRDKLIEMLGNLPEYLFEVYIEDEPRSKGIAEAIEALKKGERVILTGPTGSGKTALLAIIAEKMMSKGYKIYFLKETEIPTNKHLEQGGILIYDDLPKLSRATLTSLHRARGLIATVREEEIDLIKKIAPELLQGARIIRIPEMRREHLKEMLEKYSEKEGIVIASEAAELIVEKALTGKDKGLPQFIWLVIRDYRVKGKEKIGVEDAKTIPDSIYTYIENIMWRAIRGSPIEERIATLAILRYMLDMPGYALEEEILYQLHEALLGKRYSEAIANITRYLARTGTRLRIPHDTWKDIITGEKAELLKTEIREANRQYQKLTMEIGRILEATRTKSIELAKKLEREIAMTEAKRIQTELQTTIIRIEYTPTTIRGITIIDKAKEWLSKKGWVHLNEIPPELKRGIEALVPLKLAVKGKEVIYWKEYYEKIVRKIKEALATGQAIRIDELRKIMDPQDIPEDTFVEMRGYIVSPQKLAQEVDKILNRMLRTEKKTLLETLGIGEKTLRKIMSLANIVDDGEYIWEKKYYQQKIEEAKTLLQAGWLPKDIETLTGIKANKLAALLKPQEKIQTLAEKLKDRGWIEPKEIRELGITKQEAINQLNLEEAPTGRLYPKETIQKLWKTNIDGKKADKIAGELRIHRKDLELLLEKHGYTIIENIIRPKTIKIAEREILTKEYQALEQLAEQIGVSTEELLTGKEWGYVMEELEYYDRVGIKNGSIVWLNLSKMGIKQINLEPVGKLGKIRSINLGVNMIIEIDLSPLAKCEKLEYLYLNNNQLENVDLSPLGGLKNLRVLNLRGNRLRSVDLSPLAKCEKLEKLTLSNNQLENVDLSPLGGLKNLRVLELQSNRLRSVDLSPLAKCEKLENLHLAYNQLEDVDLSPLGGLKNLKYLSLEYTGLRSVDLSPLAKCEKLEYLHLAYNQLKKVDLGPIKHLRGLRICVDRGVKLRGAKLRKVMESRDYVVYEVK